MTPSNEYSTPCVHCDNEEIPSPTPPAAEVERMVHARMPRQMRMPERTALANGTVGDVVRRFIAGQG